MTIDCFDCELIKFELLARISKAEYEKREKSVSFNFLVFQFILHFVFWHNPKQEEDEEMNTINRYQIPYFCGFSINLF